MTGYAFLFETTVNLQHARQLRGEVMPVPTWTLGYDGSDPLERVIAERIALNAHDAGLTLQAVSSPTADLRLVRIPLPSLDARVALTDFAARLGLPQPKFEGDSSDDLYKAENELLQPQRVIPLLHLRTAVALSSRVRGWATDRDGAWQLLNLWLGTENP
jgi:hypothetical protein